MSLPIRVSLASTFADSHVYADVYDHYYGYGADKSSRFQDIDPMRSDFGDASVSVKRVSITSVRRNRPEAIA
jgi:hypothetical protein